MEVGVWCGAGILVLYNIVLQIKVYLLRKSAKEIRKDFQKLLKTNTNTIIRISSRDREMCALASAINLQLETFYEKRRCYEQGNLELKEAVTNISHDLRTPLTAICGYLDMLEEEEKSENACRYLAQIQNRTEVLKQLTEELFRYSVVVSTKEDLKPETVAVDAILADSIAASYNALTDRGITPVITLPEKKVLRHLDASALSRIFANLISNAVKYSEGDLTVTMSDTCEIAFTNTAANLSPVTAARLFDRFFTVETGRKSTGLGLAIAKVLTEEMGGSIDAEYHNQKLTIKLRF